MTEENKNEENKSAENSTTPKHEEFMPKPAVGEPTPQQEQQNWGSNRVQVEKFSNDIRAVHTELSKVIIGQGEVIEQMLIALFADGHVLLEGVPGIAKTLMAKLLAKSFHADFSRIQFTPDLMPTDVTGTSVFNMKTSEFFFSKGPIFSNIVLIDEINRAPAKTQASLFEVMAEKQITVDGVTYPMGFPFFVIATQNPVEQEGTYKLPEAQLDRFLFKIKLKYPSLEEENQILQRFKNDLGKDFSENVKAVITPEKIKENRDIINQIYVSDQLMNYIASIIHDTRNNGDIFLGASPRASLAILKSAKALAAIKGRDFVTPDDIQYVCYPVLNHRIILTPEKEMEGTQTEEVIKEIISKVEVPR